MRKIYRPAQIWDETHQTLQDNLKPGESIVGVLATIVEAAFCQHAEGDRTPVTVEYTTENGKAVNPGFYCRNCKRIVFLPPGAE